MNRDFRKDTDKMKFILNKILRKISALVILSITIASLFGFVYLASIPLEFIDNHFKENPTYQKVTTSINTVTHSMLNTLMSAIFPELYNIKQQATTVDTQNKSSR